MSILADLLQSTHLPFASAAQELRSVLHAGASAVVSASAGSGKTTLLPAVVADSCKGRVLVTQPRRVAARAGAKRIASLLGEDLGPSVAYSVKGDSTLRPSTRIEFVTPGLLLRRLQMDPELPGVDAIIFDEFHERHLDTDLCVAFAIDVRRSLREDLILIATSATVNIDSARALFEDAGLTPYHCDAECPIFPIQHRYVSTPPGLDALYVNASGGLSVHRSYIEHTMRAAVQEMSATDGDCLVFLPGVAQVQHGCAYARELLEGKNIDVVALHGSLSPAEQDRIFRPTHRRRVIVSTALAESSVTVPGVRIVVDAGLSREPRLDYASGIGGLTTVWASRASATQRSGRAAREGAGVVVRIGTEAEWAKRPAFALPEILIADLTGALLQAAVWGAPGFSGLSLCDVPSPGAIEGATRRLRSLELLGDDNLPTSIGRQVAMFPLDPSLARAALVGAGLYGARCSAKLVAFLSADLRPAGADLFSAFSKLSHIHPDAHWRSIRDVLIHDAQRIERLLPVQSDQTRTEHCEEEALIQVAAAAFPMWVAKLRSAGGRSYATVQGVGAQLPHDSALIGSEWILITQMSRQPGESTALIRSALPLSQVAALDAAEYARHFRTEAQVVNGKIRLLEHELLGKIVLHTRPGGVLTSEDAYSVLADLLSDTGLSIFSWSDAAQGLRDRMAALHEVLGEPWPDVSDRALIEQLRVWLGPQIVEIAQGLPLAQVDMFSALQHLLPWPQAAHLDALAPARMPVPVGGTRPVDWSSGRPVLALRVQEAFGWVSTPTWADGQESFVIHLLDPAGRPVAVTSDLASFWGEPYQQVRAQLRGRYTKHPWPEDPFSYEPTSRAKPRK